ncbi:extracellular solute-binding protein [Auraticoccus monumenti]|uniref:Multiple sugar transport system substrate-binding protein n=1 Tax=Auraticoccus monumenti TaxID=675864 RepID=A0A1G6VZZ5_9ACTN|nr:extracellular solute-binding protein [Auraticoccus monumenti]SDD58365.1 multiple sugar transport system substrate-binding protein [Auraticoccus monumenti]
MASAFSRRRAIQLGAAAAGAMTLGGCVSANDPAAGGGATDAAEGPLKPGAAPSGEITILDDNTNMLFKDSTIPAFEAATGITVKTYTQGNFNDLHDRFATLFAAQDTSVDVVMTWAGWSAEFGQAGWLQELDASAVPEDLIQPALDAVSWDGKVYGLPKFSSVQTMFWNKELFAAADLDPEQGPEDWDAFVAAAKAMTKDDQWGYACDIGNAAGAYQNFLRVLLLNGGDMYDADFKPTFNSEQGVEALTRFAELLNLHQVMDPASLQTTNASDLGDQFARGGTGIVFNWPFQYAVATGEDSTLDAATVGNGLIPGMSVRSASIDGSEGFAVSKFSQNKEAALAWLQFVATGEVQQQIVTEEGWFPVSQSVLEDPASVEALPVLETYAASTEFATKRWGVPWSSELDQLLSVQISEVMNERTSPQEALDSAAAQTEELVRRYLG